MNRESLDLALLILYLCSKSYWVLTLVNRPCNGGQQAEQPTLTSLLTKVNTQSFLRVNGMFLGGNRIVPNVKQINTL